MADTTDDDREKTGQAPPSAGKPRRWQAPRSAAGLPLCDLCGSSMRESHCKLICDQCGYTRDCSDP